MNWFNIVVYLLASWGAFVFFVFLFMFVSDWYSSFIRRREYCVLLNRVSELENKLKGKRNGR